MKSVDEEAVEVTTTSTPIKPQTEDHHGLASDVNGILSPSQETVLAPQLSAGQGGPAAPPIVPPAEPALMTLTSLERPASLQESRLLKQPATSMLDGTPPQRQFEAHLGPCPTNGFSLNSTETSILSPSSLSDSDLLEAVLDGMHSTVPETLMPKEPTDINVNVHIKESSSSSTDVQMKRSSESSVMGDENDETSNEISPLQEPVGQAMGREGKEHSLDEGTCNKHSDPKFGATALSEGIGGWDVPDGLKPEDLPSVSEVVPLSPKPEPKKQLKLFKRNKKKSNPGNPSLHLNKDHVWNASLLMCLKGKSLCFAVIAFYIIFLYIWAILGWF